MKRIIIILCLFLSLSSAGAQSWQLFNMLVKQGNYSDAKKILVVLDNVDQKTMSSVDACIKLQEEAEALYQKEYYTRSIEKYRQIQKYFPSDETVEICIRQCEIKRDEYNRIQEQKHQEERKRQAISAEKALWNKAVYANTIVGYLEYINKYPSGQFYDLAEMNLKSLYENDAQEKFRLEKYNSAIYNFSRASKYGTLTRESKRMYSLAKEKIAHQEEENRYKSLQTTGYEFTYGFESFLRDYPNSRYAPEIRRKLLDKYCEIGRFDDARELVEKFPKGIEFTKDYTPDVEWWMKYITKRERDFTKAARKSKNNSRQHRKQTSFNMFDGLGIMLNAGASISFTSRTEMVTKENLGIITEEEEVIRGAFFGPRVAFSIGDFYNGFNLEIGASYSYSADLGSQFPISVAPRWNIVADGEAFHLYLQPEVGYDIIRNGMFCAGRVGIGCPLGSVFFAVSYNRAVSDSIQCQLGYVYNWMWDL